MAVFQTRNTANAIVLSSDHASTHYVDSIPSGGLQDIDYYHTIECSLGGSTDMGNSYAILDQYLKDADSLLWFKFNNGARGFFPTWFTNNAGTLARTRNDVAITPGYLNVYDANHRLTWSAVTAHLVPRVIGFFDIPANFDLDHQVYSQDIGDTFILASNCPGNISDDGTVTGFSGLYFRKDGNTLRCQWVNQKQVSWEQTFKAQGLRIPYAIIPAIQ